MNKAITKISIITSICLLILIPMFMVACSSVEGDKKQTLEMTGDGITISDIIATPVDYEGKEITLIGEYSGWESEYGIPPVTRSDWILKDETGGIYITGMIPSGFDPVDDRGAEVTVKGVVRIKNDRAYIEAKEITK